MSKNITNKNCKIEWYLVVTFLCKYLPQKYNVCKLIIF